MRKKWGKDSRTFISYAEHEHTGLSFAVYGTKTADGRTVKAASPALVGMASDVIMLSSRRVRNVACHNIR